MSALHKLAGEYDFEGCSMLLNSDISPNTRDQDGCTPLHRIVQYCLSQDDPGNEAKIRCLTLLLRYGGDPNIKNNRGLTPLHYAARRNSVKCIEILLENDADVDAKNNKGKTPLHLASIWGFSDNVRLLLDEDADMYIEDNSGKTPIDVSRRPDIEEIFNKHEIRSLRLYSKWNDFP